MRQIYTSPRAENVERVVALMQQHGIETTTVNRSGWRGGSWKRFSYSAGGRDRDDWPQVWVVRADDQVRARQVLRDSGLEPAIRFADELAASRGTIEPGRHGAVSKRMKLVLLGLIAGVVVLIVLNRLAS
ncbi:hypothetical protein [Dokdonella koreensis]|uniref:Pathogenicity-related protein n=1 Tax=Dokdonella koreensis DS-123 TaxID=1300342 RepID=A0A160DT01_9GAMM|nr:hypothetical protein [Dokdonella koreensis]ANB17449.1 Pathogenicity-related protein [Dokdonella koreensis DS-123]